VSFGKKISAVETTNKSALARELKVSRSSLYYRPKKPDNDEALRREIERVMLKNPGYGSPRVAIALKINEKRAARVMKKFGLRPARRGKTPYKPADQGRESLEYPCILSQLSPIAPDVVWASDFTFICYRGTFVYLCTVIDVFTGEVLGFNISRTHDAAFVLLAIRRAIDRTGVVPQWFHSDQGSEYGSTLVRTYLTSRHVNISMNPKSSPWCNGSQESFFGRFKVEFGEFDRFDTYAELLEELYQQLYYFTFERIKTKLKMAPAEFRQEWIARQQEIHINPQLSTGYESPPAALLCNAPPSRLYEPEEQPLLLIE
jgi:putative transposase